MNTRPSAHPMLQWLNTLHPLLQVGRKEKALQSSAQDPEPAPFAPSQPPNAVPGAPATTPVDGPEAQHARPLCIAILTGSTRPGRTSLTVARGVLALAQKRKDAQFELVDLADFLLPLLDEPVPASMAESYQHEHTRRWSETIQRFDGFVFVTPEYNHGMPAALKNSIDFLYREWNNKAAGFVGYGTAGGARSVEHLRLVLAEVQVATVQAQVLLSLHNDFENYTHPTTFHEAHLSSMLDQLVQWSRALQALRS